MIYFLSNHKDTSFIEQFCNDQVVLIPHPVINPHWSVTEILSKCNKIIEEAVFVDKLIMNGDYTLIGIILLKRSELGKQTGFLAMEKRNESNVQKNSDGSIIHQNILKPIGIRWL